MDKTQLNELMNQVQSLHTEAHNFATIAAQARRAARIDSGYRDTRTDTEVVRDQQIAIDRANRYTQRAELYRQRLNAAKRELQIAIRQHRQHRQRRRDQRQSRAVWDD